MYYFDLSSFVLGQKPYMPPHILWVFKFLYLFDITLILGHHSSLGLGKTPQCMASSFWLLSNKGAGHAAQLIRSCVLTNEKWEVNGNWTDTFLFLAVFHGLVWVAVLPCSPFGEEPHAEQRPAERSFLSFPSLSWSHGWHNDISDCIALHIPLFHFDFFFSYLHLPVLVEPKSIGTKLIFMSAF